ncbi:MAG: LuxR C-terminal-related transcriptional regulator [Marinifilaceae bacterium]
MIRILLILLLFIASNVKADNYEIPLVSHFNKSIYKGANQNWSISQDDKGVIYAANNRCLLEYSGYTWKNHYLPNKMNLRSVFCYKNRIYCGSYESFGYWSRDEFGKLKYTSLLDLLKSFNFHNEEIWKITAIGDDIYFQSFTVIFKYSISKNNVKAIELHNTSSFFYNVNARLFTKFLNGGIYELKDDKLTPYNLSDFFISKELKGILPYKNNKLLVITSKDGVYIVGKNTITTFNEDLNKELKSYEVNNFVETKDGFVIGTILNGLLIVSKTGKIINKISKENSLQNNTILDLFVDKSQNIWVAMDIGIDCINKSCNIDYFHDITGSIGSVYSAVLYKDYLYIGTNHGLFRRKYKSSNKFQFIKHSEGQIWDLQVIDDVLICGHNLGTYIFDNEIIRKISDITGGYCIREIKRGEKKYLIQSTYTKLVVYQKGNDDIWEQRNIIEGLIDPIRYLEIDHMENIWCSHLKHALYKIALDKDLYKIVDIKHYNGDNCFGVDLPINVNKFKNRIVFSNGIQLYTYDDINDNVVVFDKLNSQLGEYKKSKKIVHASGNKYWLIANNKITLAEIQNDSIKYLNIITHSNIIRNLVDDNENVISIEKDKYLICLDNGYAIYNDINNGVKELDNKVFINQITIKQSGKEVILNIQSKSIEVEYDFKEIRIGLSNPNYAVNNEISYNIEGKNKQYKKVEGSGVILITDLLPDDYVLKIKSKDKKILNIKIKINIPWYKSRLSISLMILSVLFLMFIFRFLVLSYIKKQHHKLEIEKDRLQKIKDEENEKHIISLKNESLNSEIINKSKQLADSTISLIEKKSLLSKIRKEILSHKEILGNQYPNKYCNAIINMIDEHLNDNNEWDVFQANFNIAHNYFFKNISSKHSNLTPTDLRVCAYLKMNLSTKEIASLMNVSPKSVEVSRYRIRKKMDLNKDESLTNYVMSF